MKILLVLKREKFPLESYPSSEILKKNRSAFVQGWREYAGDNEFQLKRMKTILRIWDAMIRASKAWEEKIR